VKFSELEMFEESRALAETKANAAADTLVELQHPAPEPELPPTEAQESRTPVKQESAAAMQPESKHEAIPAIQATQATQATQASRSQPEAFASRPSQDVSRPSQADVQGGFLPERKVAVMATSVWDTGDNDDRIAEYIKELLFDPRQKQKKIVMELDFTQGAQALAETLKDVTEINLAPKYIGHEEAKEFKGIGDEGAKALAEALKVNKTVTNIVLEANLIGNEGTQALAEALKVNTTLTNINLRVNNIGEEGAQALAEALNINTTLTNIDLGINNIGMEGAQALAEALNINTTLTNINLEGNLIFNEGAQALAEALKVNTTLTNINLEACGIGVEEAEALAEALKINTTLTNINLEGNLIGKEGAQALRKLVGEKKQMGLEIVILV